MKKKLIITSLMMASVLPFIGGMETARADEVKSLNEKAKSELDKAKENLKAAHNEKAKVEKDLEQAKKYAEQRQKEKENLENQLNSKEKDQEANQKILDKDAEIKEIDEKRKALAPQIDQAEKDKEAAYNNFNRAKSAYDEAKKEASDNENFAKEDKTEKLKQDYEAADSTLAQNKNIEKVQQEKLKENVDKQKELANKKAGIQYVFKAYEKEEANKDKTENQDYKDFKKSIDQEIGSIDTEIQKLKGEANGINNAINSISEGTKNFQQDRDSKLKAYEKHKQALNLQKDYDGGRIKDLNKLVDDKERERQEAKNALSTEKENKEKVEADYQGLLIQEEEKKNEIARLKAAAEFLNKRLNDKTDAFVKNNEDSLSQEKAFYEQKSQAAEKSLALIQKDRKGIEEKLQNQILDYETERADYEQKENSIEVAKEFKKFIEDKKNSKYDEKVKELEKILNRAKDDLAKKSEDLDKLTQKDDALALEKNKLDDIKPEDIQKAKEKIGENKAEIERLRNDIKNIEGSEEFKKVKSLEEQIKKLDQAIKDLQKQIKNLENPRNQDNSTRPDHRTEGGRDKNISDDLGIDLSNLNLENKDKKIRLKNSYLRLKASVNRAKEVVAMAENYAKTGKMDANKRAKLIKLIEKLKVNIKLVEKHLGKLESSL